MNVRTARLIRCGLSTAIVSALAIGPSAIASAKNAPSPLTAQSHAAEDAVVHDTATEQRLSNETVTNSTAGSQAAAATVSSDPGQSGQWGPLENWPVVAINAALLPNGEVLAHDDVGDSSGVGDQSYTDYADHSYTRATVWNPVTNTFSPDWVDGFDIFCSGLAHLPSGAIFTAGGNADNAGSTPIYATYTFDNSTNIWTRGPDMTYARWYPTVTALTTGDMLIISGGPWIPEVRATDGSISPLSQLTATQDLPLYPWMNVAPDGRVFYSGPTDQLLALDPTGGGAWTNFGPRGDAIDRDFGSHVMYDVGKLLVAGGGPSTNTAETIDVNNIDNGSTPIVQPTSPMNFGRRQFNLTALADGTVLATGGNSSGATFVDMNAGVYNAERWDPATGNWTTLAAESVTRQYHSTALLLPDGRVLSAGGGICVDCDAVGYLAKNAQVFSPPYLFKHDGSGQLAPRPQIAGAPNSVFYGTNFQITTPNAIQKVGLVRLGAVTHANNMDQRYVPLSFTAGSGQLTASAPANPNVAPPGYYMLFIVDPAGVPSVAKIVWVGTPPSPPPLPAPDQPPNVTITAPPGGAAFTAPATVSIRAKASDPDGTVKKVEFFVTKPGSLGSTIKLGEAHGPASVYKLTWTGVAAGTYALTARATDNAGVTATTDGRTLITVS